MARATFWLGSGLITAALAIGVIAYQYSYKMMESTYQAFYMSKAQMLVNAAAPYQDQGNQAFLAAMNRYWGAGLNRPADEYICVVDSKGMLLLHTGSPQTVGKYAGDNPILGNDQVQEGKLCQLVEAQKNYVGEYVSSTGDDQIAAFVALPKKKWMLGVHRSRQALKKQIADGFRPFVIGFIAICAVLMPGALFMLYQTYNRAQQKETAANAALWASEERYQSLVETMPQCLYRTDIEGKMTFANRALLDTLGLAPDQYLGKTAGDIYPPETAREQHELDQQVLSSGRGMGQVTQIELRVGGRPRYIQQLKSPVYNPDGEIVGLQGIFWDVSDQKLAEEKLHQATAQLAAIMQSVPSGVMAVDRAGVLQLLNQKAEEVLGVDAARAVGRAITEVVPNTELVRTLSENKAEFGKPFTWGEKTLIVSRSPVRDGQEVIGAVSVFLDQSELEAVQKQLEEMTRLNNEYSSLLENSHDGVLVTDTENLLKVNASFGRITGLPPALLEGKPIRELDTEKHVCLATLSEVSRLVTYHRKSMTLRRRLNSGGDIFVTGAPVFNSLGAVSRVVMNVRDITELTSLEDKIQKLSTICLDGPESQGPQREAMATIVAESVATRNVADLAIRVAGVDSSVLLQGESGSGKDVFARLIHKLSRRADKPMVSVNCGAIPENLLESEFFGYEKGAFTGAINSGKPGLFEQANHGTLFLDEVGELPLSLQVKLLKVIQDRSCRRLGSLKNLDLDVRIIAATNRDLNKMVAEGTFREDLFYRLYVVPIEVPPLRERREDIMPLALMFLTQFNGQYGVSRTLGHNLLRVLESYRWPGNVRELRNVVERLVVSADTDTLEPRHLPENIYKEDKPEPPQRLKANTMNLKDAKDQLERELLAQALSQAGTTREAAKLLGINHTTVVRKAAKYGLGQTQAG